MSTKQLLEALDGPSGSLDGYLEVMADADIKADIRALIGQSSQREHFAAMAMQGLVSNHAFVDNIDRQSASFAADKARMLADALIAELAKVTP